MMKTPTNIPGESVWDHGVKVKNIYLEIHRALRATKHENQVKLLSEIESKYDLLPEFLIKNLDLFQIRIHWKTLRTYLKFHDCGKPFCKTIRPDGTYSYPDHAQVSKEKFLEYADTTPTDVQKFVAELIGRDMEPHLLRGKEEELIKFLGLAEERTKYYVSHGMLHHMQVPFLLLLVCFASLHANYPKDSVQLKIARKRWETNVKRCIELVRSCQEKKNG
jgi:hypothetical protein